MQINHKAMSWALGLFFGWLLSFPFSGPVLFYINNPGNYSYAIYFMGAHALSLFALALVPYTKINWQKYMGASALFCMVATILLVVPRVAGESELVMSLFIGMGIASSMFILGWCFPYTLYIPGPDRIRFMAGVIIKSSLIYVLFSLMVSFFPTQIVWMSLTIPLIGAAWAAGRIDFVKFNVFTPSPENDRQFSPGFLILLCLFVFGIYLNGGLMYTIMYPSFLPFEDISLYFRSIPYILVLLFFLIRVGRSGEQFIVYLGVSFLGLAFVFFALIPDKLGGYIITETLVQSAFAILDLFLWVILAEFALFYSHPFRVFGCGLAANVAAIAAGSFAGTFLLQMEENYFTITALVASGAIFLTFVTMPLLFRRMDERNVNYADAPEDAQENNWEEILDRMVKNMPGTHYLTPREKEIVKLILQGDTNKDIAVNLCISENTLKTHIKNIYRKLEISQKRELLSLALGKIKFSSGHELSPPG